MSTRPSKVSSKKTNFCKSIRVVVMYKSKLVKQMCQELRWGASRSQLMPFPLVNIFMWIVPNIKSCFKLSQFLIILSSVVINLSGLFKKKKKVSERPRIYTLRNNPSVSSTFLFSRDWWKRCKDNPGTSQVSLAELLLMQTCYVKLTTHPDLGEERLYLKGLS